MIATFFKSSVAATLSAGVNMVSTIFIVRFLGTEIYANQIVDLAQLALLMILLELLPSGFIIFKLQDEHRWLGILVFQIAACTLAVLLLIQALDLGFQLFNGAAWLISLYAVTQGVKRFNDTSLQARGMVNYLFLIDFACAAGRLMLLVTFFAVGMAPDLTVWLSLVVPAALAQPAGAWLLRAGPPGRARSDATPFHGLQELRRNATGIAQFYPTTALKRVTDTMVPIVAQQVLPDADKLTVFLLAYRSISFTSVFSRIFEALLNHRANLEAIRSQVGRYVSLLGGMSHAGAFVLSLIIIRLSGQSLADWPFLFVLAAMAWPNTAIAVLRTHYYSRYSALPVALAYAVYIAAFAALVTTFAIRNEVSPLDLAISIVAARCLCWLAMKSGHHEKAET